MTKTTQKTTSDTAPVKRGPGRPRKNPVQQAAAPAPVAAVEEKAEVRRGRKPREEKISPRNDDAWEIKTEMQINGRYLVKGTEFSVTGERGRFLFIRFVKNGENEWVDCYGGQSGMEMVRSFTVDRVKRVHYKKRTRKGEVDQYDDDDADNDSDDD